MTVKQTNGCYFSSISFFIWFNRFIASMGVRLFMSIEASLSKTDLCFWTKSESLSGCFVLCLARRGKFSGMTFVR